MRRFSAEPKLGWGVAKIDKLNRTKSHDKLRKIKEFVGDRKRVFFPGVETFG